MLTESYPKKLTFHDPCYLGRHNGEYLAPRELIEAVPGAEFIEMYRCREQSYCCGGGGGGMWLDGVTADHTKERLSRIRLRKRSKSVPSAVVCCPYEVSRFEDAVKSTDNEGKLEVLDIAEILDLCMGGE